VPCSDVTHGGVINVKVDVANNTAVAGDEIVFLFVSFPTRPARRSSRSSKLLPSFARRQPGQRVTIPLRVSDLDYFDMGTNQWVIENGLVKIMVGPDAGNLLLQTR